MPLIIYSKAYRVIRYHAQLQFLQTSLDKIGSAYINIHPNVILECF